jgi:hypothetical protein
MKTFLQYIFESKEKSEEDPRADITKPYKTPEDIKKIMSSSVGDSSSTAKPKRNSGRASRIKEVPKEDRLPKKLRTTIQYLKGVVKTSKNPEEVKDARRTLKKLILTLRGMRDSK